VKEIVANSAHHRNKLAEERLMAGRGVESPHKSDSWMDSVMMGIISAYKCPDHSVSLIIKLDKIEPASFEGAYDHTNDCIRISSDLPRRQAG
jgi:hypothetical protein